jgi:hypothetical protein
VVGIRDEDPDRGLRNERVGKDAVVACPARCGDRLVCAVGAAAEVPEHEREERIGRVRGGEFRTIAKHAEHLDGPVAEHPRSRRVVGEHRQPRAPPQRVAKPGQIAEGLPPLDGTVAQLDRLAEAPRRPRRIRLLTQEGRLLSGLKPLPHAVQHAEIAVRLAIGTRGHGFLGRRRHAAPERSVVTGVQRVVDLAGPVT